MVFQRELSSRRRANEFFCKRLEAGGFGAVLDEHLGDAVHAAAGQPEIAIGGMNHVAHDAAAGRDVQV